MAIKKVIILLVAVCITLFNSAIGQNDQRQYELRNVIPPSPNAASLGKYADWPVDLYTGLVDISIPIYELKGKEGSIPIGISYHASGIKVGEIASYVGLGWALNAGGVITRSVRGFTDEEPAGYFQTRQSFNNPGDLSQGMITPSMDEQVQIDVASGAKELDPDYFMFNAMGRAYKLFFDGSGNIITQPYSKIKFTVDFAAKLWTVVYEDGTKLKFGGSDGFVEKNNCACFGESSANYISSWMLESVTYPNGEKFFFTYSQTGYSQDLPYYEDLYKTVYKTMGLTVQHISTIESDLGKVEFLYDTATRQDLNASGALSSVKIYSKLSNTYMRQYYLIHTYSEAHLSNFYGTDQSYFKKRLKLLSLQEVIPTDSSKKNAIWKFEYDTLKLPHRRSFAQDHWGYYNGADTNTTFLPAVDPFTSSFYIRGNREPNSAYMKAEMLTKIIYPTGGSSQFEYEPNAYTDQSGYHMVGGLRIKRTIAIDDNDTSKTIKKNYVFEDPYLLHDFQLTDYLSYVTMKTFNCAHTPPIETGTSDLTFRSSSTKAALGSIQGGNIGYGKVTTKIGDNGENGKIISEFSNINDLDADAAKIFPYPSATSRDWRRGLLLSESYYTNTGSTPIRKKINTYDFVSKGSITTYKAGFKVISLSGCLPYQYISNVITRVYYNIITEQVKLTSTAEYEYGKNDSLVTVSNYYYDNNNNLNPTRVQSLNSKGDTIKIISRTPLEKNDINNATALTSTAATAIDSMLARNIISPVLQQEKYVAGVLQTRSMTNYKNWNSKLLQPENIQLQVKNNALETRIQFSKYDTSANLLEQKKAGDINHNYIWDYALKYLIAECIGADSSSIAFTSFESNGKGNWTFSGTPINDISSLTGQKYYNVSNGSISKSGLTSGTTYIVTYWTKNTSAYSITGTISGYPISGRTVGGWKYFEHRITGQTTVTLSGSGAIDELRLYPLNALMSTFSYTPLIGLTSQCDANNRISYYEYDGFGRLVLIRDMDKNIVNQICYNYAGQPENCSFFKNVAKGAAFAKTGCSTNLVGSSVTFNVAANKYASPISQAFADSLAQADANANGQAYADSAGTCNYPYARIEYSDYYQDVNFYYATVWVKFYRDASFTIPFSVSNMSVNYDRLKTLCSGSQSTTHYSATCNGSSTSLGVLMLQKEGTGTQCYSYSYYVVSGTGYNFN